MKISKKIFTAGVVAALTLSVAASAFASGLTVKTKKINEGQVKVSTPIITGSAGGSEMDSQLTQMATRNTFITVYDLSLNQGKKMDMPKYDKLMKEINNPVEEGFAMVKVAAMAADYEYAQAQKDLGKDKAAEKYNINVDYTVYTAGENLLSMEQYASSYTGGAHDNEFVKTMTVNAKTGEVYSLGDMFVSGSGYKERLEMLIAIQQKGDNRLREVMGHQAFDTKKVVINGDEKFYLKSDLQDWGIYVVYNPGEIAPMAAGIQKFYIPIDTISDIINYDLK